MAKRPDPDDDDDFSELYKEYTGPPGSMVATSQEKAKANKRSLAGSDEEEEPRDPNAVPTDFTSREAKVWEAKSKATERNWKKRKEEEMICKICGESGHFTQILPYGPSPLHCITISISNPIYQITTVAHMCKPTFAVSRRLVRGQREEGCPSTLGANRKSQDFFERVAARDKHVRALFTEKVIQRIEKDISCKIKMDEKFIIVSGKDRLILSKGVDAVHKIIKEEGDQRGTSSSHKSKSRSPEQSPVGTQLRRSESQRSHPVSHNASHFHQRICRQDKVVEDRVREDVQKFSRGSPQGRDSIGYLYGIHRKPLMVVMELEVVQAILNLLAVPLMLAICIIRMMVIIRAWVVTEMMDGILRDGDQICNQAISLNTLHFLRHWMS
ncbi:uncharacterized protein LOC18050129 isoform X6 [Citrus clementina]|uniref:uncharacterized protein LOC18050129 isoform X6 n=1 Tax=Citrus clementina TaxID=85681 RepID=UPI000CED7EE1|nr:uncharacterized protein LOC18050129 isoform X6 [Citrus x clementina]